MAAFGCLACCGVLAAATLGISGPARLGLAAYVIGWAALVVASMALSVPAWLDRWSLGFSLALLAAVALGAWVGVGRPFAASLDPGWRLVLRDPVVAALALAVLGGGVYLGALAVLTTPNDYDGLTYHETRALLWDQQGSVGYVPSGNDPRLDGNPPVSEIGLYLAMTLPRSERFAAVPQYVALWASLVAVVVLARRLGLSRPAATYAGLVFATLPVVFLHGGADPERPPRRVVPPRRRRLPHLPRDVRARRRKRRAGARTIDQVQRRPGPAARPGGRACGRAQRPAWPDGGGVRGGRDPRLAVVRAQPREDGVVRRRPRGDHGAGSGSFVSYCRGDAPCAHVRRRRHVRPLALGDVHRRRAWCRARRGGLDPVAPRPSEGRRTRACRSGHRADAADPALTPGTRALLVGRGVVRGRARRHRARPSDRLGRAERAGHLVVVVRSRGRHRDPGRGRRGVRRREARRSRRGALSCSRRPR